MSGGTRSYEMARRLVQSGHEVHIVTSWRKPTDTSDWFDEQIDGIHVHWLPVAYDNSMPFWQRIRAFVRFALASGRKAIALGGDVVFATSTPLTIALPGALAAWTLKIPMVFEVRDLWPDIPIAMGFLRNPVTKYLARALERFAYRRSARVVALSDGMADGVVRSGYPRERVTVIPNSADLELFEFSAEGAQRFRTLHPELGNGPLILYPGTLGKANGVSYLAVLAHAVRERRPDLRFVVIGDGAETELVRRTAQQLGVLDDNFFCYPSIPKCELVDAFSATSLVVSLVVDVSALWANSANKFFDALSSGTAVAINHLGWQSDLLTSSQAGIVLPTDPKLAADPLIKFMASPELVESTGRRARFLAETRFSRDVLARQLETVLMEAAAKEDRETIY